MCFFQPTGPDGPVGLYHTHTLRCGYDMVIGITGPDGPVIPMWSFFFFEMYGPTQHGPDGPCCVLAN